MFISIYYMIRDPHTGSQEISFNEFIAKAGMASTEGESEIKDVTVRGISIEGSYIDGNRFFTTGPISEKLLDQLVASGATVKFESETENSFWQQLLISWLPMIFIFVIFFMFMRQLQSGGGKAMSFGKARARLVNQSKKPITFKDVAGIDEAVEETREIVEFLKDTRRFTRLGGRIPKGVLMMGLPGTGKTLLARAIAGEAGVPFFSISGSDFVEMFVGVGASRVRDLFEQGKKNAPCLIFIDEIDAVGRHRGAGLGGGHDEREQTLNQLLVEMDGFATDKGVILMAATNRADVLDSALLRPGRFDRQIMVDKPDLKGRIDIFSVHTKNLSLSPNVNLKTLASQTPGFAGAEIANAANEAALLASRRGKQSIEMKDFEDAIERVIAGLEKKNKVINPKEKEIVAYHEAGHAIVSWLMPENDPVQKISIVPRGVSALGYTLNIPLEDRYLMTKGELIARICGLLGGRIAEEVVFGEVSTGAQNDLERVTEIAYNMVVVYGMSDKIGYLSFLESNNPYTGGPGIDKKYGDETARMIDLEVKAIVEEARNRVFRMLNENRDKLEILARELLAKEIVQYCRIEEILGKRQAGKFTEHLSHDCHNGVDMMASHQAESEKAALPAEPDPGDQTSEERKELEAAVENLRQSRNLSSN